MKPTKISFSWGALTPKFAAQIRAQGFKVRGDKRLALTVLQRDADALLRCKIRGLVPESVASRAMRKILNGVAECVR